MRPSHTENSKLTLISDCEASIEAEEDARGMAILPTLLETAMYSTIYPVLSLSGDLPRRQIFFTLIDKYFLKPQLT